MFWTAFFDLGRRLQMSFWNPMIVVGDGTIPLEWSTLASKEVKARWLSNTVQLLPTINPNNSRHIKSSVWRTRPVESNDDSRSHPSSHTLELHRCDQRKR